MTILLSVIKLGSTGLPANLSSEYLNILGAYSESCSRASNCLRRHLAINAFGYLKKVSVSPM